METSASANTAPNNASSSSVVPRERQQHKAGAARRSNSMSSSNRRRQTRSINSDNLLDEVPPDEDAQRWAEVIRQRRISRKKKADDEDTVLVGTRVSEGHTNWVTAYNMLTGIRVATSRCNAKIDRELTPLDFTARHKLAFDIQGNELTPSARYDFKFKDYAPWIFRDLRKIFQIDAADYLVSLTGKYILSELGSPGKSGSFFYFSRDYRFIIKTLRHAEHKFLRRILRDYHAHAKQYPNTLISQFYGLHRVKTSFGKKIHFVVMNNLFPPHMDIHSTYDVKGSTVGRLTTEESKKKNPRGTLKDLNWLASKQVLRLPTDKRGSFLTQLQNDVELLARLGIMDYSLLLGVHNMKEASVCTPVATNTTPERAAETRTPTTLVRTPSVSGRNYRQRDLRRMVTPANGPLTLSQIANSTSSLPSLSPSSVAQLSTSIDNTLNPQTAQPAATSGEPAQSVGMQHNIYYQFEGGIRSQNADGTPGEVIYFLGIIDLLTHYGMRKYLETFFKGLGKSSEYRNQISAVTPTKYASRFRDFISAMTKTRAEMEQGKLERTPSAVNLEQAMHEMDRENISQEAPPVTSGTVISAVTEESGDVVLPVLEEAPDTELEPAEARAPRASLESKRRSKSKQRSEAEARSEDPLLFPNRRSSTASVQSIPTVHEEVEHDGHDSGLANSLDCLPEESEPSRQSSYRGQSVNTSTNTIQAEVAPPLERDTEQAVLATYKTNGTDQQFSIATQRDSPQKLNPEERAARRQGFIGMTKNDTGAIDFSKLTNGDYEDEGYEEGIKVITA